MNPNIRNIVTNKNLFDINHEHTIETRNKEVREIWRSEKRNPDFDGREPSDRGVVKNWDSGI